MMQQLKYVMLLLGIIYSSYTYSQLTIIVENANEFHDSITNKMFVAGNFNDWNPADAKTKLKWEHGKLQVTLDLSVSMSNIEFKFTTGSWANVEVKQDGSQQPNRTCIYKPGMIITQRIESFQQLTPKKEPVVNTAIIKFNVYSPELKVEKRIRVSLPCDYEIGNINYPVLYMLDAQNLFDEADAYSGEWGVDEAMDSICKLQLLPAIIVGIDHAGEERISEYSPYAVKGHVTEPKGEAFADFVVNTLKPIIDSMYRTLPQREFTGIAGSSMGGVESMYMVVKYNDVFSKAGIFSPAFWTSKNNYTYVEENRIDKPTQIYFLAGALEGENFEVVTDTKQMIDILLNQNNSNINTRFIMQSTGRHTESFWRDEFFEMFEWLYVD